MKRIIVFHNVLPWMPPDFILINSEERLKFKTEKIKRLAYQAKVALFPENISESNFDMLIDLIQDHSCCDVEVYVRSINDLIEYLATEEGYELVCLSTK